MLVPMINRDAAVNRRQVLLAVGGLSLISVPLPAFPRPHPGESRPAHRGHPGHEHVSHGPAREASAPPYPLDKPLYYIDGAKAIALTIDDGPSPVYTPQVLALLRKYRVTATFSMIGMHVAAYPDLARAVAEDGHVIANHTWNHEDLAGMGARRVHGEIIQAADAIHTATGVHPTLFRAPYGAWTPAVIRECEHLKLIPLDWSVDPRDWARPGVRSIVRNIMDKTQPGSIILEHDGGGNRAQTVAALRIVLPRLLHEGYQFRTP
jgi:peptidoglycan-N-acetylglucosamine deacetylase